MQIEKRPKIKITIIDRKGPKGCHRGHKVGDTFDFDTERGKICPMAMHVLFPEIDILRYGGEVPGQEKGTAVVACPDADTLTVFKIERICFIMGHHHTYKAIDGIDFQILVEADDGGRLCAYPRQTVESRPTSEACLDQTYYIVNLMEEYCKRDSIPEMKKNIFKTETGKYLLEQMFEKSKR